jgi:ComF family protein
MSAFTDVVFPRTCVPCGAIVENSPYENLCTACARSLEFAKDPACTTCGHPFYGEVDGERSCPHCVSLHPAFNRGRTAVLCKGAARDLIHELKYRRGVFVMHDMERVFAQARHVLELARGAHLVPVPLHPRKQRERGYNQTLLLAEALHRALDGEAVLSPVLERVVDTPSQTAFDRKARLSNLKNAFALRPDAAIKPDLHYVLVDDVFTTGSTLNSCARVLRRAGVLNLDVVTFGHG